MLTVPTRIPEKYEIIFVYRLKNISMISRFLEITLVKGRCQRYLRGILNSMRPFSFCFPKYFFLISRFSDVAMVKRYFQKYFSDISISGVCIGEREV